jgi:hypothetical protein
MSYSIKNYTEQGGERTVIGGEIDVVSGGALKIAGTAVTKTAAQLNALPIVEQALVAAMAVTAADAAAAAGAAPTKAEYDVLVTLANANKAAINLILVALKAANVIADA